MYNNILLMKFLAIFIYYEELFYSATVPNIPTEELDNKSNSGNEKSIAEDVSKLKHKIKLGED